MQRKESDLPVPIRTIAAPIPPYDDNPETKLGVVSTHTAMEVRLGRTSVGSTDGSVESDLPIPIRTVAAPTGHGL